MTAAELAPHISEIQDHLAGIRGFPRAVQDRVDTLAECATILASACQTASQAREIATHYQPRRWTGSATFAEYVRLMLAPTRAAPWNPANYSQEELQALQRYAAASHIEPPEAYERLIEHECPGVFAALSDRDRTRLLAESAAEWCRIVGPDHPAGKPPFLFVNAKTRALLRIERHLLLGRPLFDSTG